ncbi:MAG TPA: bidirectional hydrogenase complex protein HoxU [Chloroflexota bacterium]|nr:bidirectional hydrogenase complex protein HoxU [Chloroflexota bacterium]
MVAAAGQIGQSVPASSATQVYTLSIDGRDVGAASDETILEAARDNGVMIPSLCYLDGLSAVGACRLCLVEIEGSPKLAASCVTRVGEGMRVTTASERLIEYRRMILEMLYAEGNHICSVCIANGHCGLQSLAQHHGVDHIRFPYLYARDGVDASHERFGIDHSRCILCTRCARACAEVEGAHTWDVMGRGATARLITDLNQPWGESTTCTSCGKCVNVCPTGALFVKGRSAGESVRQPGFLQNLLRMRGVD